MKKLLVLISIVTAIGSLYAETGGAKTVQEAIQKVAGGNWQMSCELVKETANGSSHIFLPLEVVNGKVGQLDPTKLDRVLRKELQFNAIDLNDDNICNVCKLLMKKFPDDRLENPTLKRVRALSKDFTFSFNKECS